LKINNRSFKILRLLGEVRPSAVMAPLLPYMTTVLWPPRPHADLGSTTLSRAASRTST
jgi:hypothetical protein